MHAYPIVIRTGLVYIYVIVGSQANIVILMRCDTFIVKCTLHLVLRNQLAVIILSIIIHNYLSA